MCRKSHYSFKCLNNQFIPSLDIACTSPVVYAQPCAQSYNPGRCQLTAWRSPCFARHRIETFTRTFFSFGNSFIPFCKSSFLFFFHCFLFLNVISYSSPRPPIPLPLFTYCSFGGLRPLDSFLIGCIVYSVCRLVTKPPAISVISSSTPRMLLSVSRKFYRGSKRINGVCEAASKVKASSTHIYPQEVTTTYCSARNQTRSNFHVLMSLLQSLGPAL